MSRFSNGTGTTSATASSTVTTGHRFLVTGGGATIITSTTAGTVTATLTTGSATHTWNIAVGTSAVQISFVIGGGAGALSDSGSGKTNYVFDIGKNFVALSTETLSLAISGPTGSTGASAILFGADYTA